MALETENLNCTLAGLCGGCPDATRPYSANLRDKLTRMQSLFGGEIKVMPAPQARVRDRVDLTWERVGSEMRLGLYGLGSREIVDMPGCPILSQGLEEWLRRFREQAPLIQKGSVRLRVSPSGERGAWLDFANQDVKELFQEKTYLKWLSEQAVVEIGQRRKALQWREGQPKLVDPILKPWFETYDADLKPIPLWATVGSFSQVGFAANRTLVQAACALAEKTGIRQWVDLFSGNGNFTLSLAARGCEVEAIENDELAVAGLNRALRPEWKVQIRRADIYHHDLPDFSGRGLLVDPPRSGLREVLKLVAGPKAPAALIYVSCFGETLLQDSRQLAELGFRLTDLVMVDQFPFTPQAEWLALFDCPAHP